MITSFRDENYFLSMFYRKTFRLWDMDWTAGEYAFQARKCWESNHVWAVRAAKSPAEARRLGRACNLVPGWDRKRKEIMLEILIAKFFPYPEMRQALIQTHPNILVHGNNHGDDYWGCVQGNFPDRRVSYWEPPGSSIAWYGKNNLGKLLMAIRHVILPDLGAIA